MNNIELHNVALGIRQALVWPYNSMGIPRAERVELYVKVLDGSIIAEVRHDEYVAWMIVHIDLDAPEAAQQIQAWATPYADMQSPEVAMARASYRAMLDGYAQEAAEHVAAEERKADWIRAANIIRERLIEADYQVPPIIHTMEVSARLSFNNAVVYSFSFGFPCLPTERIVQEYEWRGIVVTQLQRWIETGDGDISWMLCSSEQVSIAAQASRFPVLSNGMYAFSDQAALVYAWDYGLYWSGTSAQQPSAITAEWAETFRRSRARKDDAGDSDRTSIESDGYWSK